MEEDAGNALIHDHMLKRDERELAQDLLLNNFVFLSDPT